MLVGFDIIHLLHTAKSNKRKQICSNRHMYIHIVIRLIGIYMYLRARKKIHSFRQAINIFKLIFHQHRVLTQEECTKKDEYQSKSYIQTFEMCLITIPKTSLTFLHHLYVCMNLHETFANIFSRSKSTYAMSWN